MSVNAIADIISETFTKYAIPRLLALNGYDADGICLEHSPAGDTDVNLLADTLQKLGSYLTWLPDDEVWLRGALGMPDIDPEVIEERQEAKRQMAEAIAQRARPAPQQRQEPEEPDDDEENEDMMRATLFAANAPDDAKRRRYEREVQKVMEKQLAKMKRQVMTAAKEMRSPV